MPYLNLHTDQDEAVKLGDAVEGNKKDKKDIVPPVHQDPFHPVLPHSITLNASMEQIDAIERVLGITSSDSRMAEKAFMAIKLILSGGIVPQK